MINTRVAFKCGNLHSRILHCTHHPNQTSCQSIASRLLLPENEEPDWLLVPEPEAACDSCSSRRPRHPDDEPDDEPVPEAYELEEHPHAAGQLSRMVAMSGLEYPKKLWQEYPSQSEHSNPSASLKVGSSTQVEIGAPDGDIPEPEEPDPEGPAEPDELAEPDHEPEYPDDSACNCICLRTST